MRLDKYLKTSRLIKRRTIANEACDAGKVTVNGKVARASYEVKEGDVIGLNLARKLSVKVISISEYANKSNASDLYEVVGEVGDTVSSLKDLIL
jgi:ribosomal 50S subunit-recycling heat shock protein